MHLRLKYYLNLNLNYYLFIVIFNMLKLFTKLSLT